MYLESIFRSPATIEKLRNGPLKECIEEYAGQILNVGYSSFTVRCHLRVVGSLNEYLGIQSTLPNPTLCTEDIQGFFKWFNYTVPSEKLRKFARSSINRFTSYLVSKGLFQVLTEDLSCQFLLTAYCEWMRNSRNSAEITLIIRQRHVTKFLKWLGFGFTAEGLAGLTAKRVEEFFLAYAKTAGNSELRSMQSSLRTFLRFCLYKGHIQQHLDRAVPTWRSYRLSSVPKGLNEKQVQAVFDSIDRSTHAGCRDYAILKVLHTYGVRGGQVRTLRFKDIDWKANKIYFTALKCGKDSLLPLTVEVGHSLLDYIQNARPRRPFPQVFLTCRAPYEPFGKSACISAMVRNRLCSAGVDAFPKGANVFRHSFARRMIKEGISLKSIADVMGHRYLSTTQIYAKVDFDALKQVALDWPEEEI